MAAAGGLGNLKEEAEVFARYLLRAAPPADAIERYSEAIPRLFPSPGTERDRALLAFARRHPWSLGSLDAAAALVARSDLLRQRLLVMAALLETTPEGATEFLPREPGFGTLALRLPLIGLVALGRLLLGLVILPFATARA
jgi:hypothetical protein